MRLYANDVSPDRTSTEASFVEPGEGYTPKSLTPNGWMVIAGTPSQAEHQLVTWEFDRALGHIYGYYVTRENGGELMWAERFEKQAFNIKTAGDKIQITPRLTLRNKVENVE